MDKKKEKTTYWSITIIGFLSIGFSLFAFIRDQGFGSWFTGGMLGIILFVLGIDYLFNQKKVQK